MATPTRYGHMTVNPDHTPRKITKTCMKEKRAFSLSKICLKIKPGSIV
jgi:hypothetical protein